MRSKLYMATIFKDINDNSMIIDDGLYDTFDDALDGARIIIKTDCFNNSNIDLDKEEDYDNYLQNIKIEKNIVYTIFISVVSTDRKKFNTSKELMDYFNINIKNISNDNLYDFLLSLINYDEYIYDYNGNLLDHFIEKQYPLLERLISAEVDFDEDSCKQGKYTFKYHYRDE